MQHSSQGMSAATWHFGRDFSRADTAAKHKAEECNTARRVRLLLSDPGGGGLVWASTRSQTPTHPPNPTPPRGGGLCPPPTVTYKHLIEKPPLAVVRRKDATPFGYLLLSPIP